MKKYIYSIILLALSSVILSSCGTLSITKRVHNKGYHVAYTKHYTESKSDLTAESTDKQSANEETITKKNTLSKTGDVANTANLDLRSQNVSKIENNSETATTESTHKQLIPKTKKNTISDLNSTFKPMKVIFGENENRPTIKKMAPPREGGMSMLWIVILIILILWLLGYLGGLGSFIHLLLVIALILLILWLLGII